jgi:intein/homing endonuclease
MDWPNLYKIWKFALTPGPIERRDKSREPEGAGIAAADAIPDIRADGSFHSGGRGLIRLRDSTDFIDLSSVTNRSSRYKEYERLRYMAEIETATTVFADESCVTGDTLVATPFGYTSIQELEKNKAKNERFLVYCFDFSKKDFTLGWAFNPRKVKKAHTIKIVLDDASTFAATDDHRVLLTSAQWIEVGKLKEGDELMPFYRIPADKKLTRSIKYQYPRIYTLKDGWKHEKQFLHEWRTGKRNKRYDERIYPLLRLCNSQLTYRQIEKLLDRDWENLAARLRWCGFHIGEMKAFYKLYPPKKRVIGVIDNGEEDVYDLSVEKHENFATNTTIFHNCQIGENSHMFEIVCKNNEIKKELEFLFFHPRMINIDRKMFTWAKNLYTFGDFFLELIIDSEDPKGGIVKVQSLPPDSMYRIETIKGKMLEFQQSKDGPDYQSLARSEVTQATQSELAQATAIRFAPESIVHMRIGDERKLFYPYGVSLLEAARGPAHQLRLCEDAMLVYRLSRAPERRVFYIDVGNMPPFKAEAFVDRLKDQLRKKKTFSSKSGQGGNSMVEERWQAPAVDEDFWIPIRPNANSRVEVLPGACLSLDTKIPLLDGRILSLSEIIREYQGGKQLWAYSCNPENGSPVPGKITWAGITRKDTQVLRITLDNGESVVCTPDHKFPVIDKGNVEAKDLVIGESLIQFNIDKKQLPSSKIKNTYFSIYNNQTKKWEFVHRIVANYLKETSYENKHVFNEKHEYSKKNVVHHMDYNRYNNNPSNLYWMNWDDHILLHKKALDDPEFREVVGEKISAGWKKSKIEHQDIHKKRGEKISKRNFEFWSNPENKKKAFAKQTVVYPEAIYVKFIELLGQGKLVEEILPIINSDKKLVQEFVDCNKHVIREGTKFEEGLTDQHSKRMVKTYGFKRIRDARKFALKQSGIKCDRNCHGRQKGSGLKYPKPLMDYFMKLLAENKPVKESIALAGLKYLDEFKKINAEVRYKTTLEKFGVSRALKMVRYYGYEGLSQAREEAHLYNHKIVKIEWLNERIDTGTLTIDGENELHDYHNFALNCGIFTRNSNIDQIDDCMYFRNKLFISLNFPKSYMAQEDVSVTRSTLSSIDVKFSRLVERLQMGLTDGMTEIALRHLELRGFPESLYDDFQIKFTAPSHWREISENEVIEARFNRAIAIKGSQLYADLDILTHILKIPLEEAKEIVARSMIQKLQDLKLQIMSQNPQLMGIATPGPQGNEMGTEAGGPNPMIGGMGEEQPPQPAEGEEKGAEETYGQPQKAQPISLPSPTEEEIKKYDLDILDYSKEQDEEEIDELEVEG